MRKFNQHVSLIKESELLCSIVKKRKNTDEQKKRLENLFEDFIKDQLKSTSDKLAEEAKKTQSKVLAENLTIMQKRINVLNN